jgi:hypothetical protein
MRKVFLLAFSLLVFLFCFIPAISYASSEELISTPSSETVNYELPYPGILPDNPLYFFKVIRDKAVGFLISNPLKKAEFNLLQADKRLNAGMSLFNKNNITLAYSTISKAENYFSEAIDEMDKAKAQKLQMTNVKEKLKEALKRHRLEINNLAKRAEGNYKSSFRNELKRIAFFEGRLSK